MDARKEARATIGRCSETVIGLSHRIHAHPELGFAEHKASGWVATELERARFAVERGVADLPTALVATAGSGELVLGLCCEYDALPDMGHACGHNVIAGAGVATALALAPLADELGITVKVFGTPAEEGGGGKILMLDQGVFTGTHAAMMIHPTPAPIERADARMMANAHLEVEYTGKPAQAANWPHEGINAGDALTIAQVSIGLLRQQMPSGDRIHGIVTRGGEAPNIIPARTAANFYVRSETSAGLKALRPRVEACFTAGATATGATVSITSPSPDYAEFANDDALVSSYRRNALALGRRLSDQPNPRASSDMCNVSQVMPALHSSVAIEARGSVNHQPEFARHCASASADKALIDGATAMAWTCIDLAQDEQQRTRLIRGARSTGVTT